VVREIKTAENTLRLRLVTPMDRSLIKPDGYKEKGGAGQGSVSPSSTTSTASSASSASSSGLYSTEELSPASSESSGSTRCRVMLSVVISSVLAREQLQLRTKKNSWSIFSSRKTSRRHEKDEFCIEENVIFR
jgi:hypothetical protein